MKLTVLPVFPLWLIIVLAAVAIGLRVAVFAVAARRTGPRADSRRWVHLAIGVAAILCLALAATRIGDDGHTRPPAPSTAIAQDANVNVFLVVDRSLASMAEDFSGNTLRLAGAVSDMQATIAKYPDARFEVISYADHARLEWPLSSDHWSLIAFLRGFTPYGGPDALTNSKGVAAVNVSAADAMLAEQLQRAGAKHPDATNLVYVFGSDSDPGDWAFSIPPGEISGGAVFGYGTVAGADIEVSDDSGTARKHLSLNEPALQTAAQSLGIPYVPRAGGPLPADALVNAPTEAAFVTDRVNPREPHPNRREFYWFFAALGALLFGAELYQLGLDRLRRRGTGVRP